MPQPSSSSKPSTLQFKLMCTYTGWGTLKGGYRGYIRVYIGIYIYIYMAFRVQALGCTKIKAKLRVPLCGFYEQDSSMLESILGSLYVEKLPDI